MAEESQDGQDKTEEPSQRKIDKSKEDGKVLSSKEMFVLTSMAGAFLLMFVIPMVAQQMLGSWSQLFHFTRPDDLATMIKERFAGIVYAVLIAALVVGVPMLIITIATQTAVGGMNFAIKAAQFKANKISPIAGFKRMFSMKSLVELFKAILKVILLFGMAISIIALQLPSILQLPMRDLDVAVASSLINFLILLGALIVVLAIIAAIDFFYQRHAHIESLKMTKQEVKDEYKQTEGSPEVKAKIRRMQMETAANGARQSAAVDDVPNATAVITNPTHFAVALQYEVGSSEAPKVLAMGRGQMAHRIIEKAEQSSVTVFRSPLLARALYYTSDIGIEISERLYQAVAVVLAYLYRIDNGDMVEEPEVDVPAELQFDEFGQMLDDTGNSDAGRRQ